jgi:beta-lactamase regulating signal transducer with metallopeptidase domain
MASLNSWLSPNVMHALGWTLMHSLWQCLGAVALAAVLMTFSRRPSIRYRIAVAALAVMLAAPVVTFFMLAEPAAPVQLLLSGSPGILPSANPGASVSQIAKARPPAEQLVAVPAKRVSDVVTGIFANFPRTSSSVLPWLVTAWLFGVALFSLRFAIGFLLLERKWRRQSTAPAPHILALCQDLQRRLNLDRAIRYLECSWLQAPAVIGWVRPIVLLPVSALTGLSQEQLRAVIAHELAHIRRLDCFVNLFQILAEALLFYHPAIWWLNRRIRAERELCCDEIAVLVAGNRLEYARALTLMAQWKQAPVLAMAANRGPLSERIFHILGRKGAGQRMMGLTGSVLFLAAALGAANALFGIAYPIASAHAKESFKAALASIHSVVGDRAALQAVAASIPAARFAAPDPTPVLDQSDAMTGSQPDKLLEPLPLLLLAESVTPAAQPADQPAAQPYAQSDAQFPETAESVTVTATKLPGRSAVDTFIYDYPAPVRTTDKIARWMMGICPMVEGLPPRFAGFITQRLKAIARKAGTPVNADLKCRHNIEIVFTTTPQLLADNLRKDHAPFLGYFDNFHQADELAKVKHDIQAWYLTATMINGSPRVDNPRADFINGSGPGEGRVFYTASGTSRFSGGPGSTLYNVVIAADLSKLKDYEMGALADYVAMLALSQPKSVDACWEVPSITNLLSRNCELDRKTATLSDNDAAYLYGLYKMSPHSSMFQQRAEIRYFLERNPSRQR